MASPIAAATKGERNIDLDFEGTLGDLLEALAQRYGPTFKDRVMDNKGVRPFVNIFVNGEDVRYLKGLETRIEKDAVVDLLPAISGGLF